MLFIETELLCLPTFAYQGANPVHWHRISCNRMLEIIVVYCTLDCVAVTLPWTAVSFELSCCGRVDVLRTKADAIYLEPRWVSNYRVARMVSALFAKAQVLHCTVATALKCHAVDVPETLGARKSCNSLCRCSKVFALYSTSAESIVRSHFRKHGSNSHAASPAA